MELVWRLLPVALVASRAEADRPIASRVPTDQVPASLVALAERMLSWAGDRVVFSFERLDLRALLTHGAIMPATGVEVQPGAPNACHWNSAQLWQQLRATTWIATGFALSVEEGVWRRHSWLVHNDGHILETTTKRDRYYGFILPVAQAEQFAAEYQAQRGLAGACAGDQ